MFPPPTVQPQTPPTTFPSGFGWPLPAPQTGTDYYCGMCGQRIPPYEPHIHTFTFTTGASSSSGNP